MTRGTRSKGKIARVIAAGRDPHVEVKVLGVIWGNLWVLRVGDGLHFLARRKNVSNPGKRSKKRLRWGGEILLGLKIIGEDKRT